MKLLGVLQLNCIIACCFVFQLSAYAQTGKVGIGTTTPLASLHVDSTVLFTGTLNLLNPAPLPISGSGTRMMWFPDKAAFRAGYAFGNEWDQINIGNYSIAMGNTATASGDNSIAIGHGAAATMVESIAIGYANALGVASTAIGDGTEASGNSSTALGKGTVASGYSSTALGDNTTASGNWSTAMGNTTFAIGDRSTAMGNQTTASGDYSTAIGDFNIADGLVSTAMGSGTTASGTASTALGANTNAESHSSVALGRFNVGGGNDIIWMDSDPVFEIGIGSNNMSRANAMTVLKNGNVGINISAPDTRLQVTGGTDVQPGSGGFIQAGFTGNSNVTIDDNEIMARNNGAAALLHINRNGGNVIINGTNSTGNVGIGTASPSNRLHVHGNAILSTGGLSGYRFRDRGSTTSNDWIWYANDSIARFHRVGYTDLIGINPDGDVGIGTINPTAQLHTTGTVRFANFGAGTLQSDADGNISVSSDIRLKIVHGQFNKGLSAILQIEPIIYSWKKGTGYDTDSTYTGFSAQNVRNCIPEAVDEDPDGHLTLSDRPIIAALVNSVKELQTEIEQILMENQQLREELKYLRSERQ